jgi:signal transduction histidine kinase
VARLNSKVRSGQTALPPHLDHLGDLLQIQEALLSPSASLESVMHTICERAVALTGAEGSTIEMQERDELVYRVVSGSMAPYAGFRLKKAGSLSGLALSTKQVQVCEDSETDQRVDREACRKVGSRSMVIVPLVYGHAVVGVLKVSSDRPKAFRPRVVELLRLLAGFLGTAMVRAEAQDVRNAMQRKERERQLELERLRQELASLVVHDLKSPLSAVKANLEFLRQELSQNDADVLEAAVDALSASQRIDALLKSLLETSKLEQGRLPVSRSLVRLSTLVDDVCREHAQQAKTRGIELQNRIAPERTLMVDAPLLRRVVDNIVDNAFRYTPEGGRIVFLWSDLGDAVELRIGNSGPPIPPEAREQIFEKFGQAERSGRSNFGLGLYFCKLVVEAHQGHTWVESNEELPTIFAMRFPRLV